MAKVLIAEPLAQAGIDALALRHEVDARQQLSRTEFLSIVGAYDALIVRSATQVDAEALEAAGRLKVVGRAGTGLDNIDVEVATRRGVLVANAPQSNVISAAEHTVALVLAQARSIPQADASLRAGRWERARFKGMELYGKTLGVVGMGRVGTMVAQRLLAFGMRVVAHDPYVSKERAAQLGIEMGTLDEVLAQADILTVHLPKTTETVGMIGVEQLARLPQGARVVNVARGGVIDEAALDGALRSGHLGGAAVDVFAKEPATEHPFLAYDNVVVTPHLGASTAEAQDKAGVTIAEQVLLALDGQFVPYAVNVDAGPVAEVLRPFVPLSERLGRLYSQLAKQAPDGTLTVECAGALAERDTRVLTLGALRGLLGSVVTQPVTFVNAPLLAAERGLEIAEVKRPVSHDYVNLLCLSGQGRSGPVSVAGTIVGRNAERLVAVDGIELDIALADSMAFFRYEDRPGVIGQVGSLLGQAGVNIAAMQVGRRKQGGEAVMALAVDAEISADLLDQVAQAIGATEGTFARLD